MWHIDYVNQGSVFTGIVDMLCGLSSLNSGTLCTLGGRYDVCHIDYVYSHCVHWVSRYDE